MAKKSQRLRPVAVAPRSVAASGLEKAAAGAEPRMPQAAFSNGTAGEPASFPARFARPNAFGVAGGLALAAMFGWSYWPVLARLVHAWETEPDYSHGWFVVPVVCYLLWSRRASLPCESAARWGGLVLLILSVLVRVLGSIFFIDAIEAWSLILWVVGAIWLLGGWRLCWWSLPAIGFLFFMIPWPYSAERLLSRPLQQVASSLSCWMLQTIGQPALREGNVVLVADVRLNVVEACSGLRIFVSIVALAYVYCLLTSKPWWTRLAIFLAVAPVAIFANALRIALTGILNVAWSSEAARHFSHDFAGWLMLPVAGALLALGGWYLDRLIVPVEVLKPGALLRRTSA